MCLYSPQTFEIVESWRIWLLVFWVCLQRVLGKQKDCSCLSSLATFCIELIFIPYVIWSIFLDIAFKCTLAFGRLFWTSFNRNFLAVWRVQYVDLNFQNTLNPNNSCKIWGSCGSEHDLYCLLGCCAVKSGVGLPLFWMLEGVKIRR